MSNGYRIVFAGAVEVHSETGAVLRRTQGEAGDTEDPSLAPEDTGGAEVQGDGDKDTEDPSLAPEDTGGAEVQGDGDKDKGDPTGDTGKAAVTKAEAPKAATAKAEAPKE